MLEIKKKPFVHEIHEKHEKHEKINVWCLTEIPYWVTIGSLISFKYFRVFRAFRGQGFISSVNQPFLYLQGLGHRLGHLRKAWHSCILFGDRLFLRHVFLFLLPLK